MAIVKTNPLAHPSSGLVQTGMRDIVSMPNTILRPGEAEYQRVLRSIGGETASSVVARPEMTWAATPQLAYLASDLDGNDTHNAFRTVGEFMGNVGTYWSCVSSSLDPSPENRQLKWGNQNTVRYRVTGDVPRVDYTDGINGILTSTFGTGVYDWVVNDGTDTEIFICVQPNGVAAITSLISFSTTNPGCIIAWDERAAGPNRFYCSINDGAHTVSLLDSINSTIPVNDCVMCSVEIDRSGRLNIHREDGSVGVGPPTSALTLRPTTNQYMNNGSGFLGYHKAGIYGFGFYNRVCTPSERAANFAGLRARFG